jgi:hypothetical protein
MVLNKLLLIYLFLGALGKKVDTSGHEGVAGVGVIERQGNY